MKKNNPIGDTNVNKEGFGMRVIAYTNRNNCTVEFSDGNIMENVHYSQFVKGNLINGTRFKDRTGEESFNSQGQKMKIIRYRKYDDIDVLFNETGTIVYSTTYSLFKKKHIHDNNAIGTFGVGYMGYGDYNMSNSKKAYTTWVHMLRRCYCQRYTNEHQTYSSCTVAEEWHCFQNFANWYYRNVWHDEFDQLDKDILIKGNKIYSSSTCVFVDSRINKLFIKSDKKRGDYPIGTRLRKDNGKFVSTCSTGNSSKYLGQFNTPEEAFYAYKNFKEKYIKQVADEYKVKYPNFPQRLYDAMYTWEVDITD